MRAWLAPDDGRGPWYAIAAMQRPGVTIELALNGGVHVEGRLAPHPRNRRLFWWEWRPSLEEFVPLQMWTPPAAPLPERTSDRTPLAWRPWVPGVWPDPLPEPVQGAVIRRQEAGRAEQDGAVASHTDVLISDSCLLSPEHGWPYPGLALGERTPPRSRQEAEARVLRALRTMNVLPRPRNGGGGGGCWPREWTVLAARLDALERLASGERDTHVPPVRSTWLATRRDQGDWLYALKWMGGLADAHRRVIRLRAADPPYGWREIARREQIARQDVQQRYEAAIDAVWRAARAA